MAPKKVLVIDDSALSRAELTEALSGKGYEVVTGRDGLDGLKLASEIKPDLVMIDVVMPHMDGWEACRRMRALPEMAVVPIIVMSNDDTPDHLLRAFEVGGSEFMQKPMDPDELFATIEELLAKAEAPPPQA